ncbi:hypothetical protein B484DRAFT_389156 [Ochromonadaceae sp. CCMP2298]|nr:hypothetical protein B484DRAFT_389156 [Ochromonadaceae sp. CCMP2298]|mmetsp:Transcript_29405/g.65215  ORF Transcript_29405/g.65215 Transcript_29405/m.65215 type:complete len:241 (+) Transcript_29405:79-801(+)|eukprot:CAMPEP_0173252164 /NCGR_PEP_ID=MMETSP1142-20121109/20564_1 /TAXON_ID=483371 /ORGANISM="non described non described, Strain CCMP2298" /LENGTH=240 /DNA_ID=CAMNT_0014185155 /DNA_START=13 /DNA_END=735 /DNA_ORIENTATION=+
MTSVIDCTNMSSLVPTSSLYNGLPEVEDANAALRGKASVQDVLAEAMDIIESSELSAYLGVRLVHRHFRLGKDKVMVEQLEQCDNIDSLVTAESTLSMAKQLGAVPASWIFSEDAIFPFEYSTDQAVKDGVSKLLEAPQVFLTLRDLILTHHLEDLFAVAILKRQGLECGQEESMLEKSFGEAGHGGRSIVQRVANGSIDALSIVTSWQPTAHGRCYARYFCDRINGIHVRTKDIHEDWN